MERFKNITIIFLLAVSLLGLAAPPFCFASRSSGTKSANVLLQEGLYAEEVDGDLDAAIKIYEQVIKDTSAQRSHVAQAMYRQGMCYLKKRDEQQAIVIFGRIVVNYSDQTNVIEKVQPLLEELSNADPAALMPPETLIYMEIGSPGRQIETILNMLKGTPLENPLAAIGSGGWSEGSNDQRSPADIMAALLNPSMMAEFKKIRGMGIGITGVAQNNPPVVAVLYPGKSDALRGLILAGLGMVAQRSEPIEGMETLNIKNSASVAYDDKVIIIAQPPERITWCVKQYKSIISEPTLVSSNKSFAKISKKERQENALTIWANIDEVFTNLIKLFPEGDIPDKIRIADGFVDFKSIDDLITSFSIQESGIALDTNIAFKEGHNCLTYDLIRTPNLSRTGFEAIPSEAVGLLSIALGEAESAQAEAASEKIENMIGLDIGREIFANIEQITLFALPPSSDSNQGDKAIPPVVTCLGLAITSDNPQQTRQFLTRLLTVANMIAGEPMSERSEQNVGKYQIGLVKNQKLYCYMDQSNKTTVLSLNSDIVEKSITSIKKRDTIFTAGPLKEALNKLSPSVSKLVLVNVGGVIRIAESTINLNSNDIENSTHELFAQLAKSCDKTIIQLCTDEKINNLSFHLGVSGLPPINDVFGPITQLSQVFSEAKAKARAQWRKSKAPATIIKTTQAPVIDAIAEDLWSGACEYKLGNVIYAPISSDKDFSAYYKAMYDEKNLYILVDVTDDKLENYTDQWYMDDCIEVFIDADNSKSEDYDDNDFQFHFDWDRSNPEMDEDEHGKTDGVEFAMVTTEKGYRTEIKFPWTTLGIKPSTGAKIGLEVYVNDDDDGERTKLAWHSTDDHASGSPRNWGKAELAGQVGWWKLDEGSGTNAHDSSGRGNHGTLIGDTPWVADGLIGGALYFNDSNDTTCRVEIPTEGMSASAGTIALQAKLSPNPPSTEAFTRYFFGHTTIPYYNNRIQLYLDQTSMTLDLGLGDSHNRKMDMAHMDVETWYHIALTWNNGAYVVYLDGQELTTGTYNGLDTLNTFANIGNDGGEFDEAFDGTIDDVRIYNYALSGSEVKALYDEGKLK